MFPVEKMHLRFGLHARFVFFLTLSCLFSFCLKVFLKRQRFFPDHVFFTSICTIVSMWTGSRNGKRWVGTFLGHSLWRYINSIVFFHYYVEPYFLSVDWKNKAPFSFRSSWNSMLFFSFSLQFHQNKRCNLQIH